LDVVANIVGILILLVMVVGLRASRVTEDPSSSEPQAAIVSDAEVQQAISRAMLARTRVEDIVANAREVHREALERDAERVELTAYVASAQQEVYAKKQRLGADQRRDLDIRQQLYMAQTKLEDLAREQVTLASFDPRVQSVESLPTPLAQTVSGNELHIRLARGRAAVIPLDELLANFKSDAEANLWRLESRDRATVVIGPIDGFRLRYTLRRSGFTSRNGATGTIVQLERWKLLPESEELGEPVEEAVRAGSRLMRLVSKRSANSTTVTIWTYPDSFNEFRTLKKSLYDLGYATAGRPLPEGILIGGSPNGSQSAAQ
jgi:hypothetical protein